MLLDVAQQLVVALEEAAVDEVVALDAREGVGELVRRRSAAMCSGSVQSLLVLPSQIDQARAASLRTSRRRW